ncbi:MAG: hypothetical protein IPN17_22360 [Deltaproteobacteria bacterium]|jgi:hypothetical protein|nr:hypothetical protein [Deltaproteobacteria bacterium]
MDEATLWSKLRKIEALHAGTTSDGEREAARLAAERIRARLAAQRTEWRDIVMSYSLHDPWKRKLFVALCRRYGLAPYREPGQRRSTVLVLAPRKFHDKTLWPEYLALSAELEKHLADLTERVIREAIHDDVSEANEEEPKGLPEPGP